MGIFTDALKEYGLGSGEKLKLQNGDNQIRILSEPKILQTVYQGNPSTKWLAWVIDRKDGKIKLFYMPKNIMDQLEDIESQPYYKFESMPMPYDVVVKAKDAGVITAKYRVDGVPKFEPVTAAELEELKAKKPIEEVVSKLLERQAGGDSEPTVQQAA